MNIVILFFTTSYFGCLPGPEPPKQAQYKPILHIQPNSRQFNLK
jgi:hypothetical protein